MLDGIDKIKRRHEANMRAQAAVPSSLVTASINDVGKLIARVEALEAENAGLQHVIDHLFSLEQSTQPEHARIIDVAYTAFMRRDGGPCDWFTDTRPGIVEKLATLKADLLDAARTLKGDSHG